MGKPSQGLCGHYTTKWETRCAIHEVTGNDLTYRIIGAAMAVHNELGSGYKQEVYERALAIELVKREIGVERQFPVEVIYEDMPAALRQGSQ